MSLEMGMNDVMIFVYRYFLVFFFFLFLSACLRDSTLGIAMILLYTAKPFTFLLIPREI